MEINLETGDYVKIKTKESEYSGIVMPRPELATGDAIVLKLDSGYNLGIEKKNVIGIEKLKKPKKTEKEEKIKVKVDPTLPPISIISTGGTVASKVDYKTGGVVALYSADELISTVPELADVANLKSKLLFNEMSENFRSKHWKEISKAVAKELNAGSVGCVVTHGTDVMHYSTAAVSFMLRGLNSPVVFTGSQRSSDRGSSDAFSNILCSAITATSDIANVTLCMHGTSNDDYCYVHRGTRVRKMHTSRRDAFRSINEFPIAKVFPDGKIEIVNKNYNKKEKKESDVYADTKYEDRVALIKGFPNSDPEIMEFLVDKEYKGIVIEGTGLGHIPVGEKSWISAVERAIGEGISVAVTSQCLYGRVHPFVYSNLRKVSTKGVIYCEDMLPEVAYIKLGIVLGHTQNQEEVKTEMLTNYAGELSDRIDEKSFLL